MTVSRSVWKNRRRTKSDRVRQGNERVVNRKTDSLHLERGFKRKYCTLKSFELDNFNEKKLVKDQQKLASFIFLLVAIAWKIFGSWGVL